MKYELASSSWDKKEIEAINKVISTNMYTMGNFLSEILKKNLPIIRKTSIV